MVIKDWIYLSPEFYADFDNPNGNRSYIDVAKEVIKLKEEKVDGIVIDLRNNGGGSLYDVVQMAGLFIEDGPIVQVKDRDDKPSVLKDKDQIVLYDGPLAVMVNEFSASASEIFAAAIQDYDGELSSAVLLLMVKELYSAILVLIQNPVSPF